MLESMVERLGLPGIPHATAVRHFRLGRHALVAGLRLLGVGNGDVVLLPAFICRDLLAAVHVVGGVPAFYPVQPSLQPLALPVMPKVKAVVAVNFFGFPQSLKLFRDYCSEHGAALIEDNAHGYFGHDEEGHVLGTRGDLGVLSMRKTLPLPDGAALLVNRADLSARAPTSLPCRSGRLAAGYRVKRELRRIQNATGLRVRSIGESLTRTVRRIRTGHAFPIPSYQSEFDLPGDPAIHCESLRMLGQVDVLVEVKRRRDLYESFHQKLLTMQTEPIFAALPSGVAPYGYPFRAVEPVARSVADMARRRGFDCSRWPDLPASVESDAPRHYRDVWWVNFLC
jgi:hypothetical protein